MIFKILSYEKDHKEVTNFFKENGSYLFFQDGNKPLSYFCKEFFYGEIPPGNTYADKILIGFYKDDSLHAVVDILKNYPNEKTCVIGLMLLAESFRRKGYGTSIYFQLEEYLQNRSVNIVRLGVLEDNIGGILFWHQMGFKENGESKKHLDGRKIIVLVKTINYN